MSTPWQSPGHCTFRGRLGYALRLDTVRREGIDYAKALGLQNARDILPILKWNEAHHIRFMRISSEMFPFASHAEYGYSLEFAKDVLQLAGDYANTHGHRITTHPGQFTQLGSPNEDVIRRSLADLEYHAQLLDLMGLPADSVMIIHMGGAFGNKAETLERFARNFARLSTSAQRRLVLENDEIVWKVEDLLPICQRLSIPLVLDWHHDRLNPSARNVMFYVKDIAATWTRRHMRPKQHYSESRADGSHPRAHSDRVVLMPPCDPDMDLMIEAKDKEQAVLDLYRRYGFQPLLSEAESAAVTRRIVAEHMQACQLHDERSAAAGFVLTVRSTASSAGKGRTQLKGEYKRRFVQEETRMVTLVTVGATTVATAPTGSGTARRTETVRRRRAVIEEVACCSDHDEATGSDDCSSGGDGDESDADVSVSRTRKRTISAGRSSRAKRAVSGAAAAVPAAVAAAVADRRTRRPRALSSVAVKITDTEQVLARRVTRSRSRTDATSV